MGHKPSRGAGDSADILLRTSIPFLEQTEFDYYSTSMGITVCREKSILIFSEQSSHFYDCFKDTKKCVIFCFTTTASKKFYSNLSAIRLRRGLSFLQKPFSVGLVQKRRQFERSHVAPT